MTGREVYLFVVPFFPSRHSHVGSYLYDQIHAVKKDGRYRVVVLMGSSNLRKDGDYDFKDITVHRFLERNLPSAVYPGFFDKHNKRSFDRALQRLEINPRDIAVVHAHVINTAVYASHLKTRNPQILTILQHHGYDVLGETNGRFAPYGWHKRLVVKHGEKSCRGIDLHVGVSEETLNYLDRYRGIKVKNRYVLYNGVDTSKFYPIERPKNERFTIGCVANFWKIKDHITLIKAVELLRDEYNLHVEAKLVGTGYTLQPCREYVASHNLQDRVKFLPAMPHSELVKFYNSLDLFVLPSYWDTLGCVYLEASACGVPFMSAEGTGIHELIPQEDKHRWIAPRSNPSRLAQLIHDYMKNPCRQQLICDTSIDFLIGRFLQHIDQLQKTL